MLTEHLLLFFAFRKICPLSLFHNNHKKENGEVEDTTSLPEKKRQRQLSTASNC